MTRFLSISLKGLSPTVGFRNECSSMKGSGNLESVIHVESDLIWVVGWLLTLICLPDSFAASPLTLCL